MIHLGQKIVDFADSAAIVAQVDLVICVDTALAHLAGALGRPCWVLLPAWGTDWRWSMNGEDSLWYPEVMRLFRQERPGEWNTVVLRLARELAMLVASPLPDANGRDIGTVNSNNS
ncbi:MAG: hypothetical protein HQM03_12670 [Magnetococcales bacterium]|nr:hypothetical protein [Magnetococcales bacterium]